MNLRQGFLLGFVTFITGLVLPILGWGTNDIQGFFNHPARIIYSILIIFLVFFLGYNAVMGKYDTVLSSGRSETLISIQTLMPVINRLITLFILFFISYCDRRNLMTFRDRNWLRYLGIFLLISTTLFIYWTHYTLGKQHSMKATLQENHQLVTSGPYRILRHPMYTGVTLQTLSYPLVFRSWFCALLVVIIFALFIWRIQAEEKLLASEFGTEWKTYAQNTWKLIPYIY